MREYYIDSLHGDDSRDGRTPQTAWATLAKANETVFAPGDALYLARGSQFHGCLAPKGAGDPQCPVTIAPYGAGPRPQIIGREEDKAAVFLYNTHGWSIRGLDISNEHKGSDPNCCGILLQAEDFGTSRGFLVEDNYVHDVVTGAELAGHRSGAGIRVQAESQGTLSRFDGVRITGNHLVRADSVGILVWGNINRDRWFPCIHVVIDHNLLEDQGGDAILNCGTDGCVIERNQVYKGRTRATMYYAGIWPGNADNTMIRYNEVAGYVGTKDGQGYDCDFNCVGTTHMYNYSHDNAGGYMLICTAGQKNHLPRDIGTMNTLIHRNLTVNDLCRTFHPAGPLVGTVISENCVYVGRGIDIPCVMVTGYAEKMGGPEDILMTRNILAARGTLRYVRSVERLDDGTFKYVDDPAIPCMRYVGNHYLGNHAAKPDDPMPPAFPRVTLEDLEALLLDENGQAKPGLATLDAYLDYMGWPKA